MAEELSLPVDRPVNGRQARLVPLGLHLEADYNSPLASRLPAKTDMTWIG